MTFRQLNSVLSTAWDSDYESKIIIQFNEQEEGSSEEITIFSNLWSRKIKLNYPILTAHLPYSLAFKLNDMKIMYRALKKGYKDLDCILPLQITSKGITVLKGPGKDTFVQAVKL